VYELSSVSPKCSVDSVIGYGLESLGSSTDRDVFLSLGYDIQTGSQVHRQSTSPFAEEETSFMTTPNKT